MISLLFDKLRKLISLLKYILTSEDRSSKAKRSTLYSGIFKGCNIIISLIIVPVTLDFLNPLEYGIWVTLSSVLLWINYFDIGLGNGLRNKLGEALATKNFKLGQIYVSTTFFVLMFIVLLIFVIFLLVQNWIDWSFFLNSRDTIIENFNQLVVIVFALFCLNFLFKFIGNIFLADQKTHINDLLNMLGNFVSLLFIYIAMPFTKGSLSAVAIIFSASPVIVYIIAFPIVFFYYYPLLRPTVSKVKFVYFKDLFGLGIQFFFLQIGGMLIFTTSNVIISHVVGPEMVTPYSISYKYFSIVLMIFAIIVAPLWSGTTNAYSLGNMEWIKEAQIGSFKVWILTSFFSLIMLLLSPYVYLLWLGENVEISISLSVMLTVYVILINFSSIYSTFLYGMGKIRLQLYNTIFSGVVFIPLSIFLGSFLGIYGIVLALILVNISGALLNFIQFKKIASNKASGIWNR